MSKGARNAEEAMYNQLVANISRGQMGAGHRLVETRLADEFGVGRMTAREVLRRLAQEGLVELIPYKGAVVADVPLQVVLEILDLREVLEGLSCRLAAQRLGPADLAALAALVEEMEQAVAVIDLFRFAELNSEFHATIARISGNSKLAETLSRLQPHLVRYAFRSLMTAGGIQQALAEHKGILQTLQNRDAVAAERAATQHVARLRASIAQSAAPPRPALGRRGAAH